MTNTIKLRYTDKGIGVNFYNTKEEDNYKAIIKEIKPMVSKAVSLGQSDVTWDLDNMTLGHKDPIANKLLKKINLSIEH